jgi:hypothetical protein
MAAESAAFQALLVKLGQQRLVRLQPGERYPEARRIKMVEQRDDMLLRSAEGQGVDDE